MHFYGRVNFVRPGVYFIVRTSGDGRAIGRIEPQGYTIDLVWGWDTKVKVLYVHLIEVQVLAVSFEF